MQLNKNEQRETLMWILLVNLSSFLKLGYFTLFFKRYCLALLNI